MLELKILAANVLLPLAIMTATLGLLRWAQRRRADRQPSPQPIAAPAPAVATSLAERQAATLLILMGTAAIWLAFGLRVGFAWWPEDAWARIPVAIGIVGVGSICGVWSPNAWLAWTVRGAGVLLASWVVIPTGEAWEFLQPSLPVWVGVLVVSPLLAWWLLERREDRQAGVLGLGWILCLAAAAFLSKDFLRVTEPILAKAVVLGCASLATLVSARRELVSAVSGICLFGCGAAIANAQFNSFLGLPDGLSWLAIASPALAALISHPFSSTRRTAEPPRKRQLLVAVLACLLMAICVVVWLSIASGPVGESEW